MDIMRVYYMDEGAIVKKSFTTQLNVHMVKKMADLLLSKNIPVRVEGYKRSSRWF